MWEGRNTCVRVAHHNTVIKNQFNSRQKNANARSAELENPSKLKIIDTCRDPFL
jgi:hypothetical protein